MSITLPPHADFYGIYDDLLPAEYEIVMTWRRFLETEVQPIINDYWDRGEFPMQLIPKMGALIADTIGKDQPHLPKLSPLGWGILALELGRGDPSVSTFFGVHVRLCMTSIYRFGSDAQKERWLPAMMRMEKIGSWALTEPLVGSATAKGMMTTARQDGDYWVLNGEKKWSGNASFADVNVIWAKREDTGAVNGFLVERNMPGYEVTPLLGKIAKRAVNNVVISLKECVVPESNRLPNCHSFRDVAGQIDDGRAGVAWEAVGIAMGAYEAALRYSLQREQFGKPIAAFQLTQAKLANMLGNVTAMQGMMLQLARYTAKHGRATPERASLAKMFCTEKMRETVAIARALLGGNGILLEHNVARLFADAEAVYSYEGSHDMQMLIVGRAITGHSAFI